MNELSCAYWTSRWKMDDEFDYNDPNPFLYPRLLSTPRIRIPQVQVQIRYLDDFNEIRETWVYLHGNENLRGIVPDQFIDTGMITIYE